jgi:hypothetical protein
METTLQTDLQNILDRVKELERYLQMLIQMESEEQTHLPFETDFYTSPEETDAEMPPRKRMKK